MEWSLKDPNRRCPGLSRGHSPPAANGRPRSRSGVPAQAGGSVQASGLPELFLCLSGGAQALGTPDIGKRHKQADARGVGKHPSLERAAVDLQLLRLGEFQEASSFPRQSSLGTALLSILPSGNLRPSDSLQHKTRWGCVLLLFRGLLLADSPRSRQLAAQNRGQKMRPKTNTVPFASAPQPRASLTVS